MLLTKTLVARKLEKEDINPCQQYGDLFAFDAVVLLRCMRTRELMNHSIISKKVSKEGVQNSQPPSICIFLILREKISYHFFKINRSR